MVAKILQCVIANGQRAFFDATEICLPILRADRRRKLLARNPPREELPIT